jgi:hypothetical protein
MASTSVAVTAERTNQQTNQQYHTTDETSRTLKTFCKGELFEKVKYINDEHQLNGCEDRKSIGFFVTESLHVPANHRTEWWDHHKRLVARAISVKRNDCGTHMKNAVIGKYSGDIKWMLLK